MKSSLDFGARYIEPDDSAIVEASETNLYHYEARVRADSKQIERGDSAFCIRGRCASIRRGPAMVDGELVVVVRGYMPEARSRDISDATYLPYVNGCSTKQIFPAERAGDPTLQYLRIPPYSAEQAHHIHSTVRVVLILEGMGMSIVGMEGKSFEKELVPGMVCILEPMCPHHFTTPQGQALVCLPVHVWSSTGAGEFAHPMYLGTHLMNQGV